MVEHDIRAFTWSGKHGVTEASSLPHIWSTGRWDEQGNLWRHFEVINPKTKARKRFNQVAIPARTDDGPLWLFASSDGFSITIFND